MDRRTRRRNRLMKAAVKKNQDHTVADWRLMAKRLSTGFTLLALMGDKKYKPQIMDYCERTSQGLSHTPALADLNAMDMLEGLQSDLSEAVAPFNWFGGWQDITRSMGEDMDSIALHESRAGAVWVGCELVLKRLESIVSPRQPEAYVGECPACRRPVYSSSQVGRYLCGCGEVLDLGTVKATAHGRYLDLWYTGSDGQAAGFASGLVGVRVPVAKTRMWRTRGRVDVRRTDEPGLYRWNISTLARQASRLK